MTPMLWLVACKPDPTATDPTGTERVLEGPLVGRDLLVAGDALWVSAPTLDEADGAFATWSRFSAPVAGAALSAADQVLTEGTEGDLGGGLAVCPDGSLVAGAPHKGSGGGAWFLAADDTAVGTQPFATGTHDEGQGGLAVACGDLDGDALPDVVVSAPDADGVQPQGGALTIYELVDAAPDAIASVETTWARSTLGYRTGLLAGEDLDGDGVGDLFVAGSGSGRVHLIPGPLSGSYVVNTAGPTLEGVPDEGVGTSVALGDFDGDGLRDLALGAPGADEARGGLWIVPGPLPTEDGVLGTQGYRIPGVSVGAKAGFALTSPGDVDGDGTDDLLVGAPSAPGAGPDSGAAYLLLGAHLPDLGSLDDADAILLPDTAHGKFGWAVAAGDLDGDGAFELYVGAPEADVPTGAGGAGIGVGEVVVFPASVRGTVYPDAASGTIRR